MSDTGRSPSPGVGVYGGTAGSAGLACECGEEFLSTGGDWGDTPSDRPERPLRELVALLSAHACSTAPASRATGDTAGPRAHFTIEQDGRIVQHVRL
jgi:hypothetical protein